MVERRFLSFFSLPHSQFSIYRFKHSINVVLYLVKSYKVVKCIHKINIIHLIIYRRRKDRR